MPIEDESAAQPVTASQVVFEGRVWSVRTDTVEFPDARVERDVQVHPGAVVVLPIDDDDRVLMIQQYRHPVSARLWELPAGLLDVAGEPPLETARRELAEEVGYAASQWWALLDVFNSPGGSTERLRIYLARGLEPLPEGRWLTGEAEEADLPQRWVDLDEACEQALAGRLHNVSTVAGVLAAQASRRVGWRTLRPADAPWELRTVAP